VTSTFDLTVRGISSRLNSLPRVLVAAPVYRDSVPFLGDFIAAWRELSYPNADFCLVENGPRDEALQDHLSRLSSIRQRGDLVHVRVPERGTSGAWDNLTAAQNGIRDLFLDGGYDFLFMNETSRPARPHDIIERLVEHGKPVIGALYAASGRPGVYCVFDHEQCSDRLSFDSYLEIDRITCPVQVSGIGFGAILIHRSALEGRSFRSGRFAADTYLADDLARSGIPIYAAPLVIRNLKIIDQETWEEEHAQALALSRRGVANIVERVLEWKTERAIEEILAAIPQHETFVLVDASKYERARFGNRIYLPFLEREGEDWGYPPDDETAMIELTRMRDAGARFFACVWPSFWFLDHYASFAAWLRESFMARVANGFAVVFDLSESRRGVENERLTVLHLRAGERRRSAAAGDFLLFAADVGSAVTKGQCRRLAALARGKTVLKLGSWLGRSTIALASTVDDLAPEVGAEVEIVDTLAAVSVPARETA